MRALDPSQPGRILLRAVNWVGDAVMTLPALTALAQACPQAEIEVLAKPWVAPIYAAHPAVSAVRIYDPGEKTGLAGLWQTATRLRAGAYDWAVLFQNAFEAAALVRLAGIPVRLGFARDGRSLLLSHAIKRSPQARRAHHTSYYLHLLAGAGLLDREPPLEGVPPRLYVDSQDQAWADEFLQAQGLAGAGPLLGLAPGAAFGPAKCWPAERFAAVAAELMDHHGFGATLLFGSPGESPQCMQVAAGLAERRVVDLAGSTTLGQALALLARLRLMLTNDSGLMHAAAALAAPTVAVFGSTDPIATAPLGPMVAVVRQDVECAPCLKPQCERGDLICFTAVHVEQVLSACRTLLAGPQ